MLIICHIAYFNISLSLYLDTSADSFSYIRRLSETDLCRVENMLFSLMKRDVLPLGGAFL